eukprot:6817128-Pyramimonas_sp.AAC.1
MLGPAEYIGGLVGLFRGLPLPRYPVMVWFFRVLKRCWTVRPRVSADCGALLDSPHPRLSPSMFTSPCLLRHLIRYAAPRSAIRCDRLRAWMDLIC